MLFTDGITESGLPDGEEFGEQRLIASARKYSKTSSAELKKALLSDVKRFCNSQFRDDATLLVVSAVPELWEPRREIAPVASAVER